MAKNEGTVYLGYEDEEITSKHTTSLNSTVNKVGGIPDWPDCDLKVTVCPLCSACRPLLVQLYCPLENSQFHRTLYVFACLNPGCSNNSKSWLCIRCQKIETSYYESQAAPLRSNKNINLLKNIAWCNDADEWVMETVDDDSVGEELAALVNPNQKSPEENGNDIVKIAGNTSDDDEDSNSMENEVFEFARMKINDIVNASFCGADEDNKNANLGMCAGGASGGIIGALGEANVNATATCCAEIEESETDVVYVETPKVPERDLIALLKHTPAAIGLLLNLTDLMLKPFFLFVDDGRQCDAYASFSESDDHIRDLYHEYKRQEEILSSKSNSSSPTCEENVSAGCVALKQDNETYEKSIPAHGDAMFHNFVSTLQRNPGQILRYSRDMLPLVISTLFDPLPICQHCGGETICEAQILPTIIPKLKIQQTNGSVPIEFGNVLIFTCLKSCWDTPDKMRYERIIVQQEI